MEACGVGQSPRGLSSPANCGRGVESFRVRPVPSPLPARLKHRTRPRVRARHANLRWVVVRGLSTPRHVPLFADVLGVVGTLAHAPVSRAPHPPPLRPPRLYTHQSTYVLKTPSCNSRTFVDERISQCLKNSPRTSCAHVFLSPTV